MRLTASLLHGAGAALLVAALLAGAPLTAAAPEGAEADGPLEPAYIIRVQIHDRAEELPRLARMDLDLAGIDVKSDAVELLGTWDDFQALLFEGFDAWIVRSYGPGIDETTAALSDYLDPAEVTQALDDLVAAHPDLAMKSQIATTEESRPVWAMKISDNVTQEEDEPTIFFVGQHHAREVMTPEITLDIADYLLTRYATDTEVQRWVDDNEIWVVVSLNPDGSEHVFSVNSNWRKNRRDNLDGNYGVDQNRNYPFKWSTCNGSSGSTGSDTYRGPSPASEPENQGFMQLAEDHRPAINLSYHTYSELVIHPYGCEGVYTSENRLFRDMSSDMASKIPTDNGNGYYSNGTGWELLYAVDGEMNDWFYGELGSYGLTIEANASVQGFRPDYATWRDSTVERNRAGWQFLLDRLEGPGIVGHVTDACTDAPLEATTSLAGVFFTNGETDRTAEPGFGRFTWLTVPGSYTLNVSHPGYVSQSWPVDVGHAMADRPVRLVPDGSFGGEFSSFSIDDSGGDGDGQVDPGETVPVPLTIVATGGALTNVTGILSTADPYVIVTQPSVTFGNVGAGGSAGSVPPHPEIQVSSQTPDGHVISLDLSLQADQFLCASQSSFEVRVTTGSPSCPAVEETLDTDPGWMIDNSDSLGWAYGQPQGGGGGSGPGIAKTGVNVYGTNLTGDYGSNADYLLTTTAFDISSLRNVELRYWRWLNNEDGWDVAGIEISEDEVDWTEVWKGWGRDTDWQLYRHDLSGIVADWDTLHVRFVLRTDSSSTQSGWYLDDVSLCGETEAPAPLFAITNWTMQDDVKSSCTDADFHADGGEVVDVTVDLINDGNRTAMAAEAFISAASSNLGLTNVRSAMGNVLPGSTASASFRFKVADGVACKEAGSISIGVTSDAGQFVSAAGELALVLEADDGAPIPDTTDDFEIDAGWTLGSEWEIASPSGLGGSAVPGGGGGPDPSSAFQGSRVLGLDLTGLGLSPGNYDNSLQMFETTATSPVYDSTNATGVDISFERWLCVEGSASDRAAIEVFDGSFWRTVWSNPETDLSDGTWQSVSYDVSAWADGNPDFRVRFSVTPNVVAGFCGWNVDSLVIGNGYIPAVCDTLSCAAGCTPAAEVQNLVLTRDPAGDVLSWDASSDPCLEASGGPAYRVYRAPDAAPVVDPVNAWPDDTHFTDISGRDLDGSATNTSFTEGEEPLPGQVSYYLVVAMGSDGLEGPVGHFGQ